MSRRNGSRAYEVLKYRLAIVVPLMIDDGTGAGSDGALDRARSPEVLRQYLSIRGLSVTSPVLRGDTGGAFYDTDTQRLVSDARPDRKRSR